MRHDVHRPREQVSLSAVRVFDCDWIRRDSGAVIDCEWKSFIGTFNQICFSQDLSLKSRPDLTSLQALFTLIEFVVRVYGILFHAPFDCRHECCQVFDPISLFSATNQWFMHSRISLMLDLYSHCSVDLRLISSFLTCLYWNWFRVSFRYRVRIRHFLQHSNWKLVERFWAFQQQKQKCMWAMKND